MAWGKCSENEWTDFVKKVIEAAVKMKGTKAKEIVTSKHRQWRSSL
jgi:hypothetical protein